MLYLQLYCYLITLLFRSLTVVFLFLFVSLGTVNDYKSSLNFVVVKCLTLDGRVVTLGISNEFLTRMSLAQLKEQPHLGKALLLIFISPVS